MLFLLVFTATAHGTGSYHGWLLAVVSWLLLSLCAGDELKQKGQGRSLSLIDPQCYGGE